MSQGYIYFFQANDARVKIGKSIDPRRRLRDLNRFVGHQLTIIGVMPSAEPLVEEAAIHREFAAQHIEGEWFDDSVTTRIDVYRSRFLAKLPESQALVQTWVSPEFYEVCVKLARSEGRSLANWFRRQLSKIAEMED